MDAPRSHPEHDELLAQLGWMRALALRLVRDPEVADDVLQRACLLALQQSPEHVRTGERLRAWLATVTRRMVGHAGRSEQRRLRREQDAARPEALPATADLAARRELLRSLVQAVTALDEPYFSTLVRRYYEGLAATEIAAQDGITAEAVRQRLTRARQELRLRLEQTLRAGGLPALALAHPTSHQFLRGLLMAERSARPLVLKAAAATVVAALGVTAWLTSRSDAGRDPDAGSTSGPVVRAEADAQGSGAELPSIALAPAVTVAPDTATPAPTPAPVPAAMPLAAPPTASASTWAQLWQTTDATVRGDVALVDVLSTSQTLLALFEGQLADPSKPVEPTGLVLTGGRLTADSSASYALLEAPGYGKANLTVSKGHDDEHRPYTAYAFDVELDTRSGYYTGVQQDQDETTRLSIVYSLDEEGAPRSCGTLVQNQPRQSQEFHTRTQGLGPMRVGGSWRVNGESNEWKPLTLQAIAEGKEIPWSDGEAAGPNHFFLTHGETVARGDSLADPALGAFSQRLNALPVDPSR